MSFVQPLSDSAVLRHVKRCSMRSAIHLASAEALGDDLGVIFTYDKRMLSDGPLESLAVRALAPT